MNREEGIKAINELLDKGYRIKNVIPYYAGPEVNGCMIGLTKGHDIKEVDVTQYTNSKTITIN